MSPRSLLRSWLAVELLESREVPTAVAVPDGLVSWWTANNTAADATGQNNATLTTTASILSHVKLRQN